MEKDILKKRRLNPFAFPAETGVRFTLLIVAALMLSWNLGTFFAFRASDILNLTPPDQIGEEVDDLPELQTADDAEIEQRLAAYGTQLTESLPWLAWPTGLVLLVFGLAIAIYRTHPMRISHHQKLRPITSYEQPKYASVVQNAVQELAYLAGVSPPPSIEIRSSSRLDGQMFGFPKQYTLRLDGRLRELALRLHSKKQGIFRAIVLHELAHIVNQDVYRSYFAQALWTALVPLVIIPLLLYFGAMFVEGIVQKVPALSFDWNRLLTVNLPGILFLALQVGTTLVVVDVIRRSLLRIREIYADWRSVLWGAEMPLSNILQRQREVSKDKTGRWARLRRMHPTAEERLAMLRDPTGLFQVTMDLPFLAGLLLAFAFGGAFLFSQVMMLTVQGGVEIVYWRLVQSLIERDSVVSNLLTVLADVVTILITIAVWLGPVLGVAYLLAGTVGMQVQREAMAAMVMGRQGRGTYLRLWVPAVLAAVGLEIGFLITPLSVLAPHNAVSVLLAPVWLVGVTCLTWLWLVYARFFARRILGSHVGTSPPQGTRRLLTLALSLLLLVLYAPAIVGQYVILGTSTTTQAFSWTDIPPTLGMALLLYAMMFGVTWLLVRARRLVARPRCPSCGQVTHQPYAAGQMCEQCGHDLAPWLFADPPSTIQIPEPALNAPQRAPIPDTTVPG